MVHVYHYEEKPLEKSDFIHICTHSQACPAAHFYSLSIIDLNDGNRQKDL